MQSLQFYIQFLRKECFIFDATDSNHKARQQRKAKPLSEVNALPPCYHGCEICFLMHIHKKKKKKAVLHIFMPCDVLRETVPFKMQLCMFLDKNADSL